MIINNITSKISILLICLSTIYSISCAKKPISKTKNTQAKTGLLHSDTINTKVDNVITNKKDTPKYFEENLVEYADKSYAKNIRTVRLYQKNWELSDPMITLGTMEQLELHWDVLDDELTNYQYSIKHCTKDWTLSQLNEMEYLNGFNDNYVEYSENSFNSQQNYTHYAVMFPNDLISFKKSGNYIITVYPENNEEHPILTKRFYITENAMTLKPRVKYPSDVSERYYRQEVDFDLFFTQQDIINPYTNVHVEIEQNHRPDNVCRGLTPNFVKENQMVFNYDDLNVFEGGNEYRHLDLTKYQGKTAQIRHFELVNDTIHGVVYNDQIRRFKKYLQYEDINGRYIIKTLTGQDYNLESQYLKIHFSMPMPDPIAEGNIYLFGEISDYQFKDEFMMHYDYPSKSYVTSLYLKQGYYNYNYIYVPDQGEANAERIEGTHFDTENDYIFKVYYSDPQNFYDRLMLYKIINSRDNF